MSKDFLTDEEMQAMEQPSQGTTASADFISDDDMSKMESDSKPPWAQVGPVTVQNNPMDVDWMQALKDTATKGLHPDATEMTVASNPLLMMSGVPGQAAASLASKGASAIAKPAAELAERVATSPLPEQIANATNVTGHIKDFAGKILPKISENLPEGAMRSFTDVATGALGRKAAYSNPLTAIPQGISDVAQVASKGQKGLAWMLDNAPQRLGKFLPVLKSAAARGTDALATTSFILQQTEPEFQQIVKDQNE